MYAAKFSRWKIEQNVFFFLVRFLLWAFFLSSVGMLLDYDAICKVINDGNSAVVTIPGVFIPVDVEEKCLHTCAQIEYVRCILVTVMCVCMCVMRAIGRRLEENNIHDGRNMRRWPS